MNDSAPPISLVTLAFVKREGAEKRSCCSCDLATSYFVEENFSEVPAGSPKDMRSTSLYLELATFSSSRHRVIGDSHSNP